MSFLKNAENLGQIEKNYAVIKIPVFAYGKTGMT